MSGKSKGTIDWIKNKISRLAISSKALEDNLRQTDIAMSEPTPIYADVNDGSVYKGLINGVVTKEVEMIRAKMYNVLDRIDEMKLTIVGYEDQLNEDGSPILDEDGDTVKLPIINTSKRDFSSTLKRVSKNPDIDYELIYVINNTNTAVGMDGDEFVNSGEFKFELNYNETPRYIIEKYIVKAHIYKINDLKSYIEFFFYDIDDGYDVLRKSFTRNLIKSIDDDKVNTIIDFNEFGFISDTQDLGVKSLRIFLYENIEMVKSYRRNGFVVVGFDVNNKIVEYPVKDKYKSEELEVLYQKKADK